jgi:hypothetical protein
MDTETLDNALRPVISLFSPVNIQSALLTVKTDNACQLYIDKEFISQTPQHVWLPEGEHRIQIYYKNNILLYDKTIIMNANKNTEIDIPVFLNLSITAGMECAVFINDDLKGTTPFKTTMYSGTEYHIRILYNDKNNNQVEVDNFTLPYYYYKDCKKDYPETGSIEVAGLTPFLVSLYDKEIHTLPHSYSLLAPGIYNLKLFVKDDAWNKNWIFSDEIHILEPFSNIFLDRTGLVFEKKTWKCFIPSMAQFHNKQKIKGYIIAGVFCTTFITSCISYIIGRIAYNDYNRINTAITESGLGSGYTISDLQKVHNTKTNATIILNIALFSSAALYLYSCIDGWITMDHINNLFYTKGEI